MSIFHIEDGSIYNNTTKRVILKPAVIMMNDMGSPLKIGEYKELQNYFNLIPKEVNKDLSLIQFDEFEFSNEEICKFLNYLLEYTIGKDKWDEIKSYNKNQLKEFINKI